MKVRAGEKDNQTHLLLGPWVHGVDSTAKTRSGEREFGPTAAIDYDGVVLRWMDHYVKGMDNGVDQEKPVRYFVMGRNEWRESDRWPPAAVETPMFSSPHPPAVYLPGDCKPRSSNIKRASVNSYPIQPIPWRRTPTILQEPTIMQGCRSEPMSLHSILLR